MIWPMTLVSRQLARGIHGISSSKHFLTLSTTTNNTLTMLVSLTVGKVDAGVAVLLTEDKRLVSTDQPQAVNPVSNLLPTP
jgi:hypothetical protein